MDQSRHTVTKYLKDQKIHGAINNKMFKRLSYINDQLHEVELVKIETEHKNPIIVGCFILQYAKLRMKELYYRFFDRLKDLKSWRWIQTCSIWHYPRTICMVVSDQRVKKSRTLYQVETVRINFQPTQQ